jgi:hypothetical protein
MKECKGADRQAGSVATALVGSSRKERPGQQDRSTAGQRFSLSVVFGLPQHSKDATSASDQRTARRVIHPRRDCGDDAIVGGLGKWKSAVVGRRGEL